MCRDLSDPGPPRLISALVHHCRSDVASLCDDQVPEMNRLTGSVGQTHKLGLCTKLGDYILLGILRKYET